MHFNSLMDKQFVYLKLLLSLNFDARLKYNSVSRSLEMSADRYWELNNFKHIFKQFGRQNSAV